MRFRPIMEMPKEFFDVTLRIVREMQRTSGLTLADVLLRYSPYYKLFNIDLKFSKLDPVWLEFVDGFENSIDAATYTYAFYLRRQAEPSVIAAPFGCFLYELSEDGIVHPHFTPYQQDGPGPLAKDNFEIRRNELMAMFKHIREDEPAASSVAGRSWLYNIDAYRRLWPPGYIDSRYVVKSPQNEALVSHMCLWGQFLDSHGQLRRDIVDATVARATRATTMQEIVDAFPFRVLRVRAPITDFYKFYDVTTR